MSVLLFLKIRVKLDYIFCKDICPNKKAMSFTFAVFDIAFLYLFKISG